jgi:hypothetical protein
MQTKRLLTLVAAAATTAVIGYAPVTFAVAATVPSSVPAALNEGSNRWFVELSGAPLAEGGNAAALRREQAAVRALAREAGVAMKERFVYETLWNGFSVDMSAADAPRLKGIPGDQPDGRRQGPLGAGPDRQGHQGRHHRHRHRLSPPGSRRRLRPWQQGGLRLGLRG